MVRKAMAALFLSGVVGVAGLAAQAEPMTGVVSAYLQIQTALAADKMDGVKQAAQTIGTEAARMGASGEAIGKAAKSVEAAADIKAARTAFGSLSDAVIAAKKKQDVKDPKGVKEAFCPMAGKSWLQTGDQIRNPYYGSSMLTCGDFKK